MWRYFIPVFVFVFLGGMLFRGLYLSPGNIESPLIGLPVPEFSLPSLTNPSQRVENSDLTGGYSLLNVWGEWCTECYREHPFLMELADAGIPIFGYNYRDERDAALMFLGTMGNPYVAVAEDSEGRVAIDWGIYGAPETFLIGPDGTILHKRVGAITPEIWAKEFVPLTDW